MAPAVLTRMGKLIAPPEVLASLRVAVSVKALAPSVIAPLADTARVTDGRSSSMTVTARSPVMPLML